MPEPVECAPHEAEWYVDAVTGRDVPGGTETNEWDGYFRGDRPTRAMLVSRLEGTGWSVIEFKTRKVERHEDPAGVNDGPCVSGVADCPCCDMPTMVEDWRVPELCDECVASGCDADGSDPQHEEPYPG